GDVEDAHAAEALGAHRALHAAGAAVEAAARLLDRHEEQVAVDRHVTLAAGADDRRQQLRVTRVGDVVDVEPAEVADEELIAAEGEVRVREVERAGAAASAAASAACRL